MSVPASASNGASAVDAALFPSSGEIQPRHMKLRWFSVALVILITGSIAAVAQQPKPAAPPPPGPQAQPAAKPANIDRNGTLMILRSTILALDQANKTGNYTVLRDIGAPGFQAANTAARLTEIFAKLRNDKLDLSGVAVLDPQFSLLPQIEPNGLMHMKGFFPSVPSQVNFELLFAPVDSRWRLFGIAVNVGQSAPAAPSETPSPQPAAPNQPATPK
jgi:hypothetical protein